MCKPELDFGIFFFFGDGGVFLDKCYELKQQMLVLLQALLR